MRAHPDIAPCCSTSSWKPTPPASIFVEYIRNGIKNETVRNHPAHRAPGQAPERAA